MTDPFDNNREGYRECPKCGAPLPAVDEVMCQNCGTAFGVRTTVMKAVPMPPETDKGSKARSAHQPPAPYSPGRSTSQSPLAMILILVGLVAFIAALVLVLLLIAR